MRIFKEKALCYNDLNSSNLIETIEINDYEKIIQYLSQYNIYIGIYYN